MKVNLYEAKTQLSSLVDRAADGEEIIIAKNGKPIARLVAIEQPPRRRRKLGQLSGILRAAPDFDASTELDLFEAGHPGDPLRDSRG